ncbi:MAG: hypothetical protein AAF614_23230 [Chloroflexota bacterium]
MIRLKQTVLLSLLALILVVPVAAQSGPLFHMPWSTLGSGVMESENGRYSVKGSIDPMAANTAEAGQLGVSSGLWTALSSGGENNEEPVKLFLPVVRRSS